MSDWRVDPDSTLASVDAELPETDARLSKQLSRIYAKRLGRLSLDEIYLCLHAKAGLPWMLPLAVEKLEEDPLREAATHPGDLFTAVLDVDGAHWRESPELGMAMTHVIRKALELAEAEAGPRPLDEILGDDLLIAISQFLESVREQ